MITPSISYIMELHTKGVNMRKKVKGKLYFMARDAKCRLKQIPYSKLSMGEHEQELYNRVCRLLERDEVIINPIQELIDRKYYNTLSLEAKQKYIFDLSEKYKELKLRYQHEHDIYANVSNM